MIAATKKWIFLKISGAILVPLMAWFILSFISIYDQSYSEVLEFFTNPLSKFLFSLFIITCLLYTSPSPRDVEESRMPSSA